MYIETNTQWVPGSFSMKKTPRTVRDEMIATEIARVTRYETAARILVDPGAHGDGSFATMGDGCGWRKATTSD